MTGVEKPALVLGSFTIRTLEATIFVNKFIFIFECDVLMSSHKSHVHYEEKKYL